MATATSVPVSARTITLELSEFEAQVIRRVCSVSEGRGRARQAISSISDALDAVGTTYTSAFHALGVSGQLDFGDN